MRTGNEYSVRRTPEGQDALPGRGAKRRSSKGEPQRKRRRWGTRLLQLVLLLAVLVGCYAGYLWLHADKAIKVISSEASGSAAGPAASTPISMLIMGVDTRGNSSLLNTDVLMAAAFNPHTKSAVVVSIPRDSRIPVKGYKQRKVNSYYAAFISNAKSKHKGTSQEEAERVAKQEMKQAIGSYLGISLDYASIINFEGFADVIDALGGVTVQVDMNMDYDDHAGQPDGTSIHLDKGLQKLDGEQALGFVRYRKSNDGKNMSSDFQRNERQGQIIAAVTDKLKSLSGVLRIGKVLDAVGGNMRTDMPESEIKSMLATYYGISRDHIQFIALSGEWRSPYVYLDQEQVKQAGLALKAKLDE